MSCQLVIFDCDGVLVDSEPFSNRALAEQITALGLPTTTEESVELFAGRSMVDCVAIVEARLGRPVPEEFLPGYRERMYELFDAHLEAVPGIAEALDQIDLPVCVASSAGLQKMDYTLTKTCLIHHFRGRMFTAKEVERGKPHPDLFLHAAATLGAEPTRCIVVEDSLPGVEAAVAAGMLALGFVGSVDAVRLEAAGAQVFQTMAELPGLVGSAVTACR